MQGRPRKDLGLDVTHAEAAVPAFVNLIIGDDPAAETTRDRLYAVGLTPNLIYSLRNKRQRELGAAKLVAALAACEDLEVTVVGEAKDGSPALRWIIRAEVVGPQSEAGGDASLGRSSAKPRGSGALKDASLSLEPNASKAIQLSLFSHLESPDSVEIEMHNVQFTKKDSHRADIRVDFILKQRQAS
jgi:hypothetical protein